MLPRWRARGAFVEVCPGAVICLRQSRAASFSASFWEDASVHRECMSKSCWNLPAFYRNSYIGCHRRECALLTKGNGDNVPLRIRIAHGLTFDEDGFFEGEDIGATGMSLADNAYHSLHQRWAEIDYI